MISGMFLTLMKVAFKKTCQKEASGKMRVVKVRVGILRVEARASVRLVRYF